VDNHAAEKTAPLGRPPSVSSGRATLPFFMATDRHSLPFVRDLHSNLAVIADTRPAKMTVPSRARSCPRVASRRTKASVARGGTAVLAGNGSNDSKINVQIHTCEAQQPTVVNDSVEWQCRPRPGECFAGTDSELLGTRTPAIFARQLHGGSRRQRDSASDFSTLLNLSKYYQGLADS
jgi:hypothetical protein